MGTLAFFALILVFWIGLIITLGRISKWGKLAESYPDMSTGEKGETRVFQMAQMNVLARYSGTIIFEVLPSGLRIKQFVLFRLGHPTMLIPWADIEKTEEKRKGSIQRLTFFRFTREPNVTCGVLTKTGEWILEQKQKYTGRV